jgi:tetratricopeptide (TPR) repeat protein
MIGSLLKEASMKKPVALALLLSCFALGADAQTKIKLPQASPSASVKTAVGTSDVTINYHRPGIKGRKIWGTLVPFGQVWRLGANNATTITFAEAVRVEGKDVPAGTYGLFAIPAEDKWTLILNKEAHQWGAYSYKQEQDLVRFDVKPQTGPFTEWMVFNITPTGEGKAVVEMAWENLRVPFRVEVDADAVAWKSVDEALAGSPTWEDYQTAAHWALEKDQRLDEAMTWIDKASAMQESFWNHETKARLLQKAGKVDEAVAHLDKAMKLAEGKAPKEYSAGLEKLKGEWRARG